MNRGKPRCIGHTPLPPEPVPLLFCKARGFAANGRAITAQAPGKALHIPKKPHAAAQASGMVLMREDAQRLIDNGTTSREEVLRVTRD